MNRSNLQIRLNTSDLENILDALRVICVTKPVRARQALGALVKFQAAGGGRYFNIGLAELEIACEALAARYQKTSGPQRAGIDEAMQKVTDMLIFPSTAGSGEAPNELEYFKDILINRRPICDRNLKVDLYRPDAYCVGMSSTSQRRARYLTRRSLNLIEENLDDFTSTGKVLLNLPDEYITSGEYQRFAKDRVILGLRDSEGSMLPPEVLAQLHAEGYGLALSETNPHLSTAAGKLASIVRMDLRDKPRETLAGRLERVREHGARLLAEGVESPSDFHLCAALKFDLFEGHFFSRPDNKVRDIPLTTLSTLRLITALQNPDVRLQELEEIVRQSLPLSYRLLRFLNSAYVGLPRAVLSIRHAVGLAGMRRIQQWASLLLFSSIEDKPRELFLTAAIRARMCEQLADSNDEQRRAIFFTVGLLSVLDAVLDVSITEAVEALPLSDEIRDALIQKTGPIGSVLQTVVAYERSDWDNVSLDALSATTLREAYLESLNWGTAQVTVMSEQSETADAL